MTFRNSNLPPDASETRNQFGEWRMVVSCCCRVLWSEEPLQLMFYVLLSFTICEVVSKNSLKIFLEGWSWNFLIFPYYFTFTFIWISRGTLISWCWIQGISTPYRSLCSPEESTDHSPWSQGTGVQDFTLLRQTAPKQFHTAIANGIKKISHCYGKWYQAPSWWFCLETTYHDRRDTANQSQN